MPIVYYVVTKISHQKQEAVYTRHTVTAYKIVHPSFKTKITEIYYDFEQFGVALFSH
jgi:hypothetical protein